MRMVRATRCKKLDESLVRSGSGPATCLKVEDRGFLTILHSLDPKA